MTSAVTAHSDLRWPGLPQARTANRIADRRLGPANGPSSPFQQCNAPQLASRRLTVDGACGPSRRSLGGAERRRDVHRHFGLRLARGAENHGAGDAAVLIAAIL